MRKFHIKKQIFLLYLMTSVGYFQIAGASWVALLAARGFSLLEIGILESIFHIVSFCFEIPSGILADVFGRKKTLVIGQTVSLASCITMILSQDFLTVAFSMGLNALSYNLASGTMEALAYDSLKLLKKEDQYTTFAATETMLYKITTSFATLLAGLALGLGYKKAYSIDLIFHLFAIILALELFESSSTCSPERKRIVCCVDHVITGSIQFLTSNRKARSLMLTSSLISSLSILVVFFLQAKLPMTGLNTTMLGPALFLIGTGAALGSKMVSNYSHIPYRFVIIICSIGVGFSFAVMFTNNPFLMIIGGFLGSLLDNFLSVKTDILLNQMIPSDQRATLVSVNSFLFSMIMIVLSTFTGWLIG